MCCSVLIHLETVQNNITHTAENQLIEIQTFLGESLSICVVCEGVLGSPDLNAT